MNKFQNYSKILIGLIIVLFGLSVLYLNPNIRFDPDFNHDAGGPVAWERWHVGETIFNVTLTEIKEKPLRATLEYNNEYYYLRPLEVITLGEHNVKMLIYLKEGYVWPKWDTE